MEEQNSDCIYLCKIQNILSNMLFDFTTNPNSILLRKGIQLESEQLNCVADARLNLTPTPYIVLNSYDTKFVSTDVINSLQDVVSLDIDGSVSDWQCFGWKLNVNIDENKSSTDITLQPRHVPITVFGNETSEIDYIVFHLFNITNSLYNEDRFNNGFGPIYCKNDQWTIWFPSVWNQKDNVEYLKNIGGYRLTHIGVIRKKNDETITGKEAEEILHKLYFFLSFIDADWMLPICPVGFDKQDKKVWEQWTYPLSKPRPTREWTCRNFLLPIEKIFRLFMLRFGNNDWTNTLQEIIYWYIQAHTPNVDTSIILSQTAIERLVYEYVVNDKKLLSDDGFIKIWASDKFRSLFSSLGIAIDIPQWCPTLQKYANCNGIKWIDAPHALTEVRNSIAHSKNKYKEKIGNDMSKVMFEASRLSLWYLDLSILAICDYDIKSRKDRINN